MTIDKAQLKALAEAAGFSEWYASGDLRYCEDKTGEVHGLHHDDGRLIAAASPATILALLAEIERLNSEAMHSAAGSQSDREQIGALKAELAGLRTGYEAQNEVIAGLRKDAERWRWWAGKYDGRLEAEVDALMAKEESHG